MSRRQGSNFYIYGSISSSHILRILRILRAHSFDSFLYMNRGTCTQTFRFSGSCATLSNRLSSVVNSPVRELTFALHCPGHVSCLEPAQSSMSYVFSNQKDQNYDDDFV
jgi:hypothetical protein